MKTVLVTGALGFVGINMIRLLAQKSNHVIALAKHPPDRDSLRYLQGMDKYITWVEGDITDRESLVMLAQNHQISHVFHAAAVTATRRQELNQPFLSFDVNAWGTLNVLEAGRQSNVERIIYVSSGGLYGAAPPTPIKHETDPLEVKNLYAIAKLASEHLCFRYNELFEPRIVIGRLGTAYGPMERPTESRENMSSIYKITHAASMNKCVNVVGAEISRDFCHIDDVCNAYLYLLCTDTLHHDIYNIGSPKSFPLREALDALVEENPHFSWCEQKHGHRADVIQTSDNSRAGMDISRIFEDTGWLPKFDLIQGSKSYFHWLQSNK